jgi:hypothetical protein
MTYDPHKSTTEVRQADGRRGNLRVLLWSTLGIIVLFAIVMIAYLILAPAQPPLS